jgi:hypothetical protein
MNIAVITSNTVHQAVYYKYCVQALHTYGLLNDKRVSSSSVSSDLAQVTVCSTSRFQARSQNFEKRLLASSCLSDRPFARMEQLGPHRNDYHEILMFEYFSKICRDNSSFIKIGQQ